MLIPNKKAFLKGFLMALVFAGVLVAMFMPLFDGKNAFRAADALFNTISKGSTDYIEMLEEQAKPHEKAKIDVSFKLDEKADVDEVVKVLSTAGADVEKTDDGLQVQASMGKLIAAALQDCDDMFHNKGDLVKERYGLDEKHAMLGWWYGLGGIERGLKKVEQFTEAAFVAEVLARGVAVGYNYYGVEPQKASERWLIITGALLFYVIYTLWWGFAIFFMFEGFGLQLTAGKKKEV